MTVKTVKNVALPEIPNFYSVVLRAAHEVPAVRVEGNRSDFCFVRIIMLDKSLGADIPDFDRIVI